MRIHHGAHKHGITDEQIMAALRVPIAQATQGSNRLLILAADNSGQILELVVLNPESDDPCVIHADKIRQKFMRLLR